MQWLITNPLFAWMLPLAAMPVLFHFFLRFRTRPAVFSTFMFFDDIDPRMRARRRIHEWLVLLLRCLFIVLLLMALSRPVWMGGHGGGRTAAVMIVDNSGSMGGGFRDDMTRLRAATDAARGIVGRMGNDDFAGVVLAVDDPTVSLPAELSADKGLVRSSLDRIVETDGSGDPAWALRRAFGMLEAGSAAAREVHIFSDLQEGEWGGEIAGVPEAPAGTLVFVHRIPAAAPAKGNLSLAGFGMPAGRLLSGRRAVVRARISNPGVKEATGVLHWMDDGGARGTEALAVAGGTEKSVPMLLQPGGPGWHWVYAWLQDDGFGGDNRGGVGLEYAEKVSALLVGAKDEFGVLPLALSPSEGGQLSGIRVEFGSAEELPARLPKLKPALVAVSHAVLAAAGSVLEEYVRGGGNLLVLPGAVPAQEGALPAWVGAKMSRLEETRAGAAVVVQGEGSVLLADLKMGQGPVFGEVKAFRFCPMEANDGREAVIGLEDGRTLLVAHREGGGFVFACGIGFDPSWSTLPLKAAFLAIVQRMALASGATGTSVQGVVAGERPSHLIEGSKVVMVKSVAGSAFEWKGEVSLMPGFPRAAVLSIRGGEQDAVVGVRSSEREGVPRYVAGERVPALGALSHKVRALGDVHSFVDSIADERRGLDLYPQLLALALLCLLAETWLANTRWRAPSVRGGVRKPGLAGGIA